MRIVEVGDLMAKVMEPSSATEPGESGHLIRFWCIISPILISGSSLLYYSIGPEPVGHHLLLEKTHSGRLGPASKILTMSANGSKRAKYNKREGFLLSKSGK